MNKRKASSDISNKRMLSWSEAQEYTGLGRASCRTYCESIGAIKKYGRRVLFDRYIIDEDMSRKEG